jgi:ABC-type branched-subunit amino acid transport system ATPase component
MSDVTGAALAEPPAREPAGAILEVEGLTKRFGGFTAVDDVQLGLVPGRITAMIGPNGAGKSTCINLLDGALLPTKGEVRLRGARVDGLPAHEIASRGVARTFQTPKIFGEMTALETVMLARDRFSRTGYLGAALHGPRMRRDERESTRTALGWMAFVGLDEMAQAAVGDLPVGNQRLLEVARALATEPDVLLLDEPAAGLDHTETHALGQLVRKIAAQTVAVLLVEHDMSMVMSIADEVVVLDQGKRIASGTPAEVGRNPQVVEAYLGTVQE